MLERKAYKTLLNWKNTEHGRSALLIEGARRVGKSLLVEEFGSREYRSYLLIDFSTATSDIKNLFETKREDLDSFFSFLSVYYGVTFYKRDTLKCFLTVFSLAKMLTLEKVSKLTPDLSPEVLKKIDERLHTLGD